MTEDIYGMLKRRFPLVKSLRVSLNNAINIVVAAVVLHNISLEWADDMPLDDHPNLLNIQEPPQPRHLPYNEVNIVNDLNPAERRNRAAAVRDNYRYWYRYLYLIFVFEIVALNQSIVSQHLLHISTFSSQTEAPANLKA
jgi:hypothetical protein